MASIEELRNTRIEKLNKLRSGGLDPYPAEVQRTHTAFELYSSFDKVARSGKPVFVVGRLRALREHGGATFADVEDGTGRFQVFLEEKSLGKKTYKVVSELTDIGDFIEVSGVLFKTKKNEKTLRADTFKIISKALRPIPEEHFGLKDVEGRLRRRYLDILVNPQTRKLFQKKAHFWKSVRAYLDQHGFIEVDTPALEDIPGGADARPFITHHHALDRDFYLRISLELPLKKIIIGGFEKVYEIGKVFRNEGISAEHLQDYLLCELYWAYTDYNELMEFIEQLYKHVIKETTGGLKITYNKQTIDWGVSWPKIDYFDLFEKVLDIRVETYSDRELKKYAQSQDLEVSPEWGRGRIMDYIWKKKVRDNIIQPILLINHPVEVSPLAKRMRSQSERVERFQVIAAGTEIGNGWSELNDPLDQRKRFEEQQSLREKGDEEAQMKDESFLEALEYGMPPVAGFGFSERFFAVLMGKPVRETVFFPPMREKND